MNGYEKALSDLADSTQANKQPGDYEKDGLLYCGKCNTAKQVSVMILGRETKPFCMCKCEEEAYKKQQENIRETFRREEIDTRNYYNSKYRQCKPRNKKNFQIMAKVHELEAVSFHTETLSFIFIFFHIFHMGTPFKAVLNYN